MSEILIILSVTAILLAVIFFKQLITIIYFIIGVPTYYLLKLINKEKLRKWEINLYTKTIQIRKKNIKKYLFLRDTNISNKNYDILIYKEKQLLTKEQKRLKELKCQN